MKEAAWPEPIDLVRGLVKSSLARADDSNPMKLSRPVNSFRLRNLDYWYVYYIARPLQPQCNGRLMDCDVNLTLDVERGYLDVDFRSCFFVGCRSTSCSACHLSMESVALCFTAPFHGTNHSIPLSAWPCSTGPIGSSHILSNGRVVKSLVSR